MIDKLLRRIFGSERGERGQIMMVAALFITIMAGGAAMAIDVGSYVSHRRSLQNDVDAIALAASLNLPVGESAHSAANEWASKNGVDINSMTVTVIQQNLPGEPNPKVRIDVEVEHSLTFARVLGLDTKSISVTATAIITTPAGGAGVSPLSVTQAALAGATLGEEVTLKYDANNIEQGNTAPIRVDGQGSGSCGGQTEKYCHALMFGSDNVICAAGADTTYCDGATTADTETGNKVGPTSTAIDYRIDSTETLCSEFEGPNGAFEDDPTTSEAGVYRIKPECNPFVNGEYDSGRILIIPIIDELCNGSCEVTITGFALFFLERIGENGCTGVDCEIVGRFVKVNQNVGLLAGTYDEDAYNKFVRLVD